MGCLSCQWDDIEFNGFVLKNPDYSIMIVSTFLGLTVPEDQKEDIRMVNGEVVKFNYPKVVAYNYRYRETVENQNSFSRDGRTKYQIFLKSAR